MKIVLRLTIFSLLLGILCGCKEVTSGALWTDVDYENESAYIIGGGEIAEEVCELKINWVTDSIEIKGYNGEKIKIEETMKKEIEEKYKLRHVVEDNKLIIQFATNGRHDIRGLSKKLTVLIPNHYVIEKLEVNSISGDIDLSSVAFTTLQFCSISGNINLDLPEFSSLKIETISGKIDLTLNSFSSLDIETVSGNIRLNLPNDLGFVLSFDTVSGAFNSEVETQKTGNVYTHLTGESNIVVDSVSGNLYLIEIDK